MAAQSSTPSKQLPSIYCRVHTLNGTKILAACDRELIGQTIKVSEEYSFLVPESFYKGELVSEKQLALLLKEVDHINLMGTHCVRVAVNAHIADKAHIKYLNGIPHAQVYSV